MLSPPPREGNETANENASAPPKPDRHKPAAMRSHCALRAMLCCLCALATNAFRLTARPSATTAKPSATTAALLVMREPDSRSRSREQLLPDLCKALDEVALFVSKADRSRMRKPEAPTSESIEAYCAVQQMKIDLLLAEAELMRETGGPSKVKWTDIDGNLYNDAVWLKPPFS